MQITAIISSGILELYAAGLTSEKETRQVQEWLVRDPEITAELSAISYSLESYVRNFVVSPGPGVKEKILAQISVAKNTKALSFDSSKVATGNRSKDVSTYWRMAAAASFALLIASITNQLLNINKYSVVNKELVETRQTLTMLQEKQGNIERDLRVVKSKYSVPVSLKGLNAAPDAAAKIFWMKNTGEVFIDASNLPVAPAGKRYQLWGIVDGKPVDGGMLLKARNGTIFQMQKMKSFGRAEAFAITLEPENGNSTPLGPMYVMGKL